MSSPLYPLVQSLQANIEKVVLGKPDVVKMCVVTLLAGEHLLLEDVPGVGKTLVGKALAKSIQGKFTRIQFTPDLLPSDIVGSNVFDTTTNRFNFVEGPIFANIVLADEINRTTPRTQSALLEAMSDKQVSLDGSTYRLTRPFMVAATQNPFEFEGTYPLPESQLDRFLMRISMGYPAREHELRVFETHRKGEPIDELGHVLDCEQVMQLQTAVTEILVDPSLHEYLLDIVHATRDSRELHVGVSTRGALSFFRACQALALVEGRTFVIPDDIKRLAVPVIAHRVIPKGYVQGGQRTAVEAIVGRLVNEITVPH